MDVILTVSMWSPATIGPGLWGVVEFVSIPVEVPVGQHVVDVSLFAIHGVVEARYALNVVDLGVDQETHMQRFVASQLVRIYTDALPAMRVRVLRDSAVGTFNFAAGFVTGTLGSIAT